MMPGRWFGELQAQNCRSGLPGDARTAQLLDRPTRGGVRASGLAKLALQPSRVIATSLCDSAFQLRDPRRVLDGEYPEFLVDDGTGIDYLWHASSFARPAPNCCSGYSRDGWRSGNLVG
jgi:hypothetical protein